MDDEKLKKEFNHLYISELITVIVCASLMFALTESTGTPLDLRLLLPGGILMFIILQNAGYWFYRYHQLGQEKKTTLWVIPLFYYLKKIDQGLLCLYPLFCLYLIIFDRTPLFVPMNIFGLILYAFSIIETISYFYYPITVKNIKEKIPAELAIELAAYEKTKGKNNEIN